MEYEKEFIDTQIIKKLNEVYKGLDEFIQLRRISYVIDRKYWNELINIFVFTGNGETETIIDPEYGKMVIVDGFLRFVEKIGSFDVISDEYRTLAVNKEKVLEEIDARVKDLVIEAVTSEENPDEIDMDRQSLLLSLLSYVSSIDTGSLRRMVNKLN